MNKTDKIKEWILINYTKKVILRKFNTKLKGIKEEFLRIPKMEYYYNNFNNCYEWEIVEEIGKNVDEKFTMEEEKDLEKISFFIENYIKVIIPEFRKSVMYHEDKK